jgi:hypothetical protein
MANAVEAVALTPIVWTKRTQAVVDADVVVNEGQGASME